MGVKEARDKLEKFSKNYNEVVFGALGFTKDTTKGKVAQADSNEGESEQRVSDTDKVVRKKAA